MTWMRCSALLDGRVMSYSDHQIAHAGRTGDTVRLVPFEEALRTPPECHGRPMVTLGGWRLLTFRLWIADRRGQLPPLECDIQGRAIERAAGCRSHGWWESDYDRFDDRSRRCPRQRLVAWLYRQEAA